MKEIKAIIKPFVLERVIEALREIKGLPAMTISRHMVFLPSAERSTRSSKLNSQSWCRTISCKQWLKPLKIQRTRAVPAMGESS
jgi:hypothetical protein